MEPLPTALKRLLKERDMTETELMARADVSPATVSLYLSGRRGRRMNSQAIPTVEKLAAALLEKAWEDLGKLTREVWAAMSVEAKRDVYELMVREIIVAPCKSKRPEDIASEVRIRIVWR